MKIEVKKFGEILVSRPSGREAFLVARSYLKPEQDDEPIEIDFEGVKVVGPSWASEFVGGLRREYGGRVTVRPTKNPSVLESLKIIEEGA